MTASYPDLKGVRVLLVSQDAQTAKMAEVFLPRAGGSLRAVAGIAEALALAEGVPGEAPDWWPNLIIGDWKLPDGTGAELLHALRNQPRFDGIPFLALVTNTSSEWYREFLPHSIECALCKPVNPMELLSFIQRIMKFYLESI